MSKYQVLFTPKSEEEILEAYNWGVDNWGQDRAESWLRALHKAVFDRLSTFPRSCAIAPESDRLSREVHHYLFNRYRIIFEIQHNIVIVLRLIGPFTGDGFELE